MELQRGVCTLCAENTRVLTSSDAEHFSKCLPELLYENFLSEPEFQNIKNAIKICGICCYKIEIAQKAKTQLTEDHVTAKSDACYFCNSDKCVMKVEKNWKYFTDRTEHLLMSTNSVLGVCPRCLFYFDVIFTFKTKLSYKFPQLVTHKKKIGLSQKQNDTPKRRSLSTSPSSTKKRKIFDNCFDYLQPLCNNNYSLNDEVKSDDRLYKGIAYVDLKNAKNFEGNETPKMRPIIKIKLKPKSKKKPDKEKLIKSAEIPSIQENNTNHRRHSSIGIRETSEEKLDETPKSASAASLVPKRRVSTYIDNSESQEKMEVATDEPEEVKEDTEKPVEESPAQEVPTESKEEIKEIETNGVDKSDAENIEINANTDEEEVTNEAVNGDKEEETTTGLNLDVLESPGLLQHSPKSDVVPKLVDSDSSEEDKNKSNIEQDGVERKKKRVTFSDDILEEL